MQCGVHCLLLGLQRDIPRGEVLLEGQVPAAGPRTGQPGKQPGFSSSIV